MGVSLGPVRPHPCLGMTHALGVKGRGRGWVWPIPASRPSPAGLLPKAPSSGTTEPIPPGVPLHAGPAGRGEGGGCESLSRPSGLASWSWAGIHVLRLQEERAQGELTPTPNPQPPAPAPFLSCCVSLLGCHLHHGTPRQWGAIAPPPSWKPGTTRGFGGELQPRGRPLDSLGVSSGLVGA